MLCSYAHKKLRSLLSLGLFTVSGTVLANYSFPLGPIGGTATETEGSSLLRITAVDVGSPGGLAGLQAGDEIYSVNGEVLPATGSAYGDVWKGAVSTLGYEIEKAQASGGSITLGVMRQGVGAMTVNLTLPAADAWKMSYPLGDARSEAYYEKMCADLHSWAAASSDGNFGYNTGTFGMILLASPDWNSTTGDKPYRNSINKLKDRCVAHLNAAILEPVEPSDPNYVGVGLENWDLTMSAMFLGEYRRKTGDTSVDAAVQRAAEMLANRIQYYAQTDDGGTVHNKFGLMGHGGVTGDYPHVGLSGLNIINAHTMVAMGILKGAGADFSQQSGGSGLTIDEKFLMNWNWLKSTMNDSLGEDDGNVGYGWKQGGYDSTARTSGAAMGYQIYLNAGGTAATADDIDKRDRMQAYCVRQWQKMQHAHAYTASGVSFNMMLMPFLDERSRRHFMENNRFLFTLSQDHNGSIDYFPGRGNNGGDSYIGLDSTKYYLGMAHAAMSGNLPSFPAVSSDRIYARLDSHDSSWPALDHREVKVSSLAQALDLTILDANGDALASGYTATWSQVSGSSVSFSTTSSEDTTVTFPSLGTYRLQLDVTSGSLNTSEVYEFVVSQDAPAVAPSITSHPKSRVMAPGGNVSLSVGVTGDGTFYYEWKLDGVSYWGASGSPTLNLSNISKNLEGDYVCHIYHPDGVLVSDPATITVTSTSTVTAGGLRREWWNGLSGGLIGDLIYDSRYPLMPDITEFVTSFETASGSGDNYGEKFSGWIVPPTTGDYRFYMASDDGAELWLSTDDTAANKVRIINKTGYNGYRSYSNGGQSALISLVAGQRYYVEALHTEGGGGDHLSVAWQLPGGAAPANGSEPIGGEYLEGLIDQADPVYSGLKAWWPMDEGAGTVTYDKLGSAADGTIQGATWAAGKDQNALVFDGNDSINCGNNASLSGTTPFTVSAWVKVDAGNATQGVIIQQRAANGYNGQFRVTVDANGTLGFYLYGNSATQFNFSGATAINDGQWHHVTAKRDGVGNASIWLDGVLDGSVSGTTVRDLASGIDIGIGADIRDSNRFFHGAIDEVRLYSRELSTTEIVSLSQFGGNQTPVIYDAAYSVSEGAATGTSIGTPTVLEYNAGDTLSYAITAGNAGGEFAINSSTGEITTTVPLDYEYAAQYVLTVEVSDGSLSDTATVTVDVNDLNEAPIPNLVFGSVLENAVVGTSVTTVTGLDQDAGDSISYAIIGGNDGSFAINSTTGEITTAATLDFETTASYSLLVELTDNGGLTAQTTVGINVGNVLNDDSDNDSISDEWEVSNFGSVAFTVGSSDSDGDGLTNAEEEAIGSDPNSSDSDSDGFADVLEVTVGTDLTDAQSTPDSTYSGLHSWWNLDETAGATAALDSSGSGFHASVNDITFNGSEAIFDGVNDGLNAGTAAAILGTGDYTVSARVKTAPGFNALGTVIQQRDTGASGYLGEYMLNVNADGTVNYFIYNNGFQVDLTTNVTVNDGNWHHIMAVRSGIAVTLYIDGVQAAQGSGVIQELLSRSVTIGYDHRDNNKHFNGSIDDVRVYNRAVDNQEFYSNSAPAASDATFSVNENAAAGTSVGTVVATDPDAGDTLAYAITSGNAGGEFAINSATGAITTTTVLDYEAASQYVLTVEVTDSALLSDTATITVNVSNVNEAPVANDASGSVAEDAALGTAVATVTSSDVDAGDSVSYAITSGNTGGAFAINGTTGEITTASALDYETTTGYLLTVTVTDVGGLADVALVDVTVTDVADTVSSYSSDAEAVVSGSILSGSMADTIASNNVYEILQEDKTGGKPSSRLSYLEHIWSFDIDTGGALVELSVEAFHSANNEGDDFVFSYSTDGINFTDLLTVTKTADDNTAQTAALPAGVSGTVYIRAKDTDRTSGNGGQDTLAIDLLKLEVTR